MSKQSSLLSFNFSASSKKLSEASQDESCTSSSTKRADMPATTTSESTTCTATVSSVTSSSTLTAVKRKRKQPGTGESHTEFQSCWGIEYPWLRSQVQAIDNDKQRILLFCMLCEKANKRNAFTRGSPDSQKSAIKRHMKTDDHREAAVARSSQDLMRDFSSKGLSETKGKQRAVLRTVYYMAKEEIPDRKFVSLIELQRENGCEYLKTETYTHHDSVKAMQGALADTVREEISQKISDSPFVGILVDETVNVTVHKKLIMFLKIVDDGKPRTIFIGNYTVLNGTAQTVADKILSVIGDHGIEISKVMGLGSDGASVMTGRHNGVGVRLKHQNVYLIHVHCAAHRLALAAADASRGVKKVTEYKKTVNNIFNFFKYSATRYQRLRELNKILESEDVLSLKEPCSVRWLSFGRAVKGIYDNWPALVMEFDEEAAQRDNAVAGGLLKQIKQYSFLAITHLLMDVLPIMDRCNLVFQREDVNLATIEPMVQSTIASLQLLLEPDSLGEHESKLTREIENNVYRGHSLTYVAANHIEGYANVRRDFITYLIERLRARFPSECTDLLTCLDKVLNASKYPDRDVEIHDYGTESLATLIAHFGATNRVEDGVPMVAPVHGPDLRAEFTQMKLTLRAHGRPNFCESCRILINEYGELFPMFRLLACIALVIPVSSVPCERGFSCQNRVLTARRNRLGDDHADDLMLLTMEGPSVADFRFDRAREIFASRANRNPIKF